MTFRTSEAPYTGASHRWSDIGNVILAAWFFVSPWVLHFAQHATGGAQHATEGSASWNAWIGGAIAFFVALSSLRGGARWQEGVNLFLGAWFFISPWILGFTNENARWNHWIVGALMFLFSAYSLYSSGQRSAERERTTPRV